MKKVISIVALVLALLLSLAVMVSAEEFTSQEAGFSNIQFDNGYYGFCIDSALSGAAHGDSFQDAGKTSVATNNKTGVDVSQKLKILFTQCFEKIFVSDGNGGYIMDDMKADSSVQNAVWYFTDGTESTYIWGDTKTFVEAVNAYDGPEIPDNGYIRTLDNGDKITFYFTVVEPQNTSQQAFFAYKIEVNNEPEHVHDYSDEWKSDDDNHWHECDCGDKKDTEAHEGNEPDCVTPSTCEECEKKLADENPDKHTGNTEVKGEKPATEFEDGYTGDTYCSDCDELLEKGKVIPATHVHDYSDEWKSDDDNHWHECECGDKKDTEAHEGNEPDCVTPSTCEECEKKLADENPDKHTGNTEVKGEKPATEFEDGYTGDTYCADCDELLEKGKVIPATHVHDYSDEWKSDDDNHWHECECGDKKDIMGHIIVDGTCKTCNSAIADSDDTDNDTDTDTDIDTDVDTDVDTDIDTDVDTDVDTDIDTDVDTDIDTDIDTDVDTDIDTDIDTDVDTDIDTDIDTDVDTDTDSDETIEMPVTGRTTNVALLVSIMVLSMCAIVATAPRKRKDSIV